jgi:hypothetical protein
MRHMIRTYLKNEIGAFLLINHASALPIAAPCSESALVRRIVQPWNDVMDSPVTNAQRDVATGVDAPRVCTPETGASETVREPEPVLQWTTRLRDFLVEENRYEIDALSFATKMKEAEFIHQPSQGELAERSQKRLCTDRGAIDSVDPASLDVAFPPEFDFETFLQYYQEGCGCPFEIHRPNSFINRRYASGDSYYSRDDYRPYERLAVENRGKPVTTKNQDITVLWLSPTVFISSHMFTGSFSAHCEGRCSVELIIRPVVGLGEIDETFVYELEKRIIKIQVYSIDPSRRFKPKMSPPHLPFLFLKHLLHPLPVDYFTAIKVIQVDRPLEATSYPLFLWALFQPETPAPVKAKNFQDFTEIRLESPISYEQLLCIMEHRFNPYTRLVFSDFDDATVGAEKLNDVLRNRCLYTPNLELPDLLYCANDLRQKIEIGEVEPFTSNPRIQTLTSYWCRGLPSCFLERCCKSGIQGLSIRLDYDGATLDGVDDDEDIFDYVGNSIIYCALPRLCSLRELTLTYDAGQDCFQRILKEHTEGLVYMSDSTAGKELCHASLVKVNRSVNEDEMMWRPAR